MAWSLGRVVVGTGLPVIALCWCARASAQNPPGASFPPDPAPAPAPAPQAAPAPPPATAPAPTPTPFPPAATPAPTSGATPAPAPAPPAAPPAPAPQPYAADPNAQPGYGSAYGEPPPPPAPPSKAGSSIPPFSVRLDPINWILIGRLGLELEVGVLKWLTIEAVPLFIVNDSPPLFKYASYDVHLSQHSGGLGALAGASLGVNFWLSGKALKGYALQTGLTNYSLEYESKNDEGQRVDFVSHVERQFYVMLGSVSRWGAFTLAGGIGLGYDLNNETRCFDRDAETAADAKVGGDCGSIQLAVRDAVKVGGTVREPLVFGEVSPFTYPWEIRARFSLGVTID